MVPAHNSPLLNRAQKVYQTSLERSPKAHALLKAMGLESGAFALALGLGYADGSSFKQTLSKQERRECQDLGLFGKRHMDGHTGFLSFPLMKEGCVRAFLAWDPVLSRRKVVGSPEGAFLNPEALERHKEIILTDSPVLYVQLRQLGFNQSVCLPEPKDGGYLVERLKATAAQSVHILSRKSIAQLHAPVKGVPVKVQHLALHHSLTLTEEVVREALRKARTLQEGSHVSSTPVSPTLLPQRSIIPSPSSNPKTQGSSDNRKNGQHTFAMEEITYSLQPIDLTSASLKVILSAEIEGSRYTDKIDLYLAVSRRAFSKACAEKFLLEASRVEGDLHRLIAELEKSRDAGREGQCEVRELTQEDAASIEATIQNPSILDEFVSDMRQTGFVGEDGNLKLGFLMSVSRLLDKPLSIIIQSSSGVGKSHLLNLLCAVTPPESLLFMSKMTPSSLFYMPDLRHKMLCVDEAHGSSDALYPLRTLQSNHKLVLAVPIKDASSGTTQTKQILVKGPVSYIESTTSESLHPENASRAFILQMDESPEQTRRILQAQLHQVMKGARKPDEALHKKWQNIQRVLSLKNLRVYIPYAQSLQFPLGPNARRDHQKMLSLIQAVALLRSGQRDIQQDEAGACIEATPEDYAIAHELMVPLMGNPLDELSEKARELLEILQGRERVPFTRRQIMEEHRLPYSRIWRAMEELERQDIIALDINARGKAPAFCLLDAFIPGRDVEGLTSPLQLCQSYPGKLNSVSA